MPTSDSPLRYPGGKTKLFSFVSKLIDLNLPNDRVYIEPFAGGSGLAIRLLLNQKVDRIVLNDLDYSIYCIWDLILNNSDELCEFIRTVPLNIAEWKKRRNIYENQKKHNSTEIGLSAFYLNRTNVSGVLKGGVIGGQNQTGDYLIDARFKRDKLIEKVNRINAQRSNISLYNLDAKDFILTILPNYPECFVYFDPPYVKKGSSLYKNAFTNQDHITLCRAIENCNLKWIITYDRCDFIENLYSHYKTEILTIKYSAGQEKSGDEIVIYSPSIIH